MSTKDDLVSIVGESNVSAVLEDLVGYSRDLCMHPLAMADAQRSRSAGALKCCHYS